MKEKVWEINKGKNGGGNEKEWKGDGKEDGQMARTESIGASHPPETVACELSVWPSVQDGSEMKFGKTVSVPLNYEGESNSFLLK